jgi:hypothetical protein
MGMEGVSLVGSTKLMGGAINYVRGDFRHKKLGEG